MHSLRAFLLEDALSAAAVGNSAYCNLVDVADLCQQFEYEIKGDTPSFWQYLQYTTYPAASTLAWKLLQMFVLISCLQNNRLRYYRASSPSVLTVALQLH